jgi:hypothetical protein
MVLKKTKTGVCTDMENNQDADLVEDIADGRQG